MGLKIHCSLNGSNSTHRYGANDFFAHCTESPNPICPKFMIVPLSCSCVNTCVNMICQKKKFLEVRTPTSTKSTRQYLSIYKMSPELWEKHTEREREREGERKKERKKESQRNKTQKHMKCRSVYLRYDNAKLPNMSVRRRLLSFNLRRETDIAFVLVREKLFKVKLL